MPTSPSPADTDPASPPTWSALRLQAKTAYSSQIASFSAAEDKVNRHRNSIRAEQKVSEQKVQLGIQRRRELFDRHAESIQRARKEMEWLEEELDTVKGDRERLKADVRRYVAEIKALKAVVAEKPTHKPTTPHPGSSNVTSLDLASRLGRMEVELTACRGRLRESVDECSDLHIELTGERARVDALRDVLNESRRDPRGALGEGDSLGALRAELGQIGAELEVERGITKGVREQLKEERGRRRSVDVRGNPRLQEESSDLVEGREKGEDSCRRVKELEGEVEKEREQVVRLTGELAETKRRAEQDEAYLMAKLVGAGGDEQKRKKRKRGEGSTDAPESSLSRAQSAAS